MENGRWKTEVRSEEPEGRSGEQETGVGGREAGEGKPDPGAYFELQGIPPLLHF
jgi:hypothetical protein